MLSFLTIGPFTVFFLGAAYLFLFASGIHLTLKNRYGIVGFLTLLIFPVIGSVVMIIQELAKNKKSIDNDI